MVTTPVVPPTIHTERPLASAGTMFAPEIETLEATLPRQVINALEAIVRQMETEIFRPILRAPGLGQLQKEFKQRFQRFANLYTSQAFLLWTGINMNDMAAMWTPIATWLKEELENRGSETIGEEATNDMLVGLATVSRINRRLFAIARADSEPDNLQELQAWSIAYWLALSCVYFYHNNRDGNEQNVRVLAYWSRHYATGMYRCAKHAGVMKVPEGKGSVPGPSEEDRLLSEGDIDDFAARLGAEDGGGS